MRAKFLGCRPFNEALYNQGLLARSRIWTNTTKIREYISEGLHSNIGDGNLVIFWEDRSIGDTLYVFKKYVSLREKR